MIKFAHGNPSLNYGSLSGLICFAGFAGTFFAGLNPFGDITWLWVWVPVLMIVLSMKAVRDVEPGGPFPYSRALKTGIKTTFFSSLLYCLLLYLLGTLAPVLMDIYKEEMIKGLEMTQSFFSESMLDQMYEEVEKSTIAKLAWSEFMRKMFGGFLISLVAGAVLYRKQTIYPAE